MRREMSNEQRAAHIVLPLVYDLVKSLRAESIRVDVESRRAAKTERSHDAKLDWTEIRAKQQGRLEGAQGVLELLKRTAAGTGPATGPGPVGGTV